MESTFAVLLWGVRLLFLLLVYVFLIQAFGALQRSLRAEQAIAARPSGIAYLVVRRTHQEGPPLGERLPLRAVSAIGREAGNDVVVNDEAASARHAVLSFIDGEWWIEDAGSTNGTVVNGTRIYDRERLRYGDELAIGRVALRLEQA